MIVGLGNPGRRYERTRHNVGFAAVARLAARWGLAAADERDRFGAKVAEGVVRHRKVMVVRPQNYMNRSGQPVASLAGYHKLAPTDIIVVHDDMDLPFATIRCKAGGGHGGHNGLRDLICHLGADFDRVRIGIGRPPEGWEGADYVLGRWTEQEEAALPDLLDTACDAIETILSEGIERAMNRFNVRRPSALDDARPPKSSSLDHEEP